jgi:hypothetical protein
MERDPDFIAAGYPHAIGLKSVIDVRLARDLQHLILAEEGGHPERTASVLLAEVAMTCCNAERLASDPNLQAAASTLRDPLVHVESLTKSPFECHRAGKSYSSEVDSGTYKHPGRDPGDRRRSWGRDRNNHLDHASPPSAIPCCRAAHRMPVLVRTR